MPTVDVRAQRAMSTPGPARGLCAAYDRNIIQPSLRRTCPNRWRSLSPSLRQARPRRRRNPQSARRSHGAVLETAGKKHAPPTSDAAGRRRAPSAQRASPAQRWQAADGEPADRADRRNHGHRREPRRMVAARPAEHRGRAGESGPVRGARGCRAAVRERPAEQARARCSSRASRTTTTRRLRRSRGSRCSTCCSAPAIARRSTSSRCNTSSQFERRRRRGRRGPSRRPGRSAPPRRLHRVTGKLTAASAAQLEGLKRAIGKQVSQARLDLGVGHGIRRRGRAPARRRARRGARKQRYPLALQRPEKLRARSKRR